MLKRILNLHTSRAYCLLHTPIKYSLKLPTLRYYSTPDDPLKKILGKRIMVCHDGSVHAEKALQEALDIMKKQDHMTILRVSTQIITDNHPECSKEEVEKMLDQELQELQGWEKQVTKAGFENTGILAKGDPKDVIVEKVKELDIDLLVIGSHGLSRLEKGVHETMGETCRHIIDNAPCNVLIVKEHFLELTK